MHSYHMMGGIQQRPAKSAFYSEFKELLLDYGRNDRPLRFMCMPGLRWEFENELIHSFESLRDQELYCIGFERDYETLLDSLEFMPGVTDTYRPDFFHVSVLDTACWAHENACVICEDVNTVLRARNNLAVGDLSEIFTWDAAWLDYYGPICDTMGRSLRRLHLRMAEDFNELPVAVTVMRGREQIRWNQSMRGLFSDTGIDRQGWLEYHIGGGDSAPDVHFETLGFYEYHDTCPMCTIYGFLTRK